MYKRKPRKKQRSEGRQELTARGYVMQVELNGTRGT